MQKAFFSDDFYFIPYLYSKYSFHVKRNLLENGGTEETEKNIKKLINNFWNWNWHWKIMKTLLNILPQVGPSSSTTGSTADQSGASVGQLEML